MFPIMRILRQSKPNRCAGLLYSSGNGGAADYGQDGNPKYVKKPDSEVSLIIYLFSMIGLVFSENWRPKHFKILKINNCFSAPIATKQLLHVWMCKLRLDTICRRIEWETTRWQPSSQRNHNERSARYKYASIFRNGAEKFRTQQIWLSLFLLFISILWSKIPKKKWLCTRSEY